MRPEAELPTDPDVDLRVPQQRAELRREPWTVLAAISVGGMLGAVGRYAVAVVWPSQPDGFPVATFAVNVSGCLLIGVLMVLVTEIRSAHRLLRPLLGVGVLGGYTTFSAYAVQAQHLLVAGAPRLAVVYLGGTLIAALAAVFAGITLTRLALGRSRGQSPGDAVPTPAVPS